MADESPSNKKPKRRQCAQTRKNLSRATWYYRDGEYFVNKAAYKEWKKKKIEEEEEARAKAEAEAKEAAEAPAAEATA